MNERFSRRVAQALRDVGQPCADNSAAARVFYRRAVPTEARAGLAPPAPPGAGLRTTSNGDVVLVAADFPGARFDVVSVDAALHAARAAGAMWAVASVAAPGDVAVLRELAFQPIDADDDCVSGA
ncbi:MAG: hypothetical protein K8T90_21405 [Planctomycetes bacterium]|nr:hypothetical protein [Planctomycetota bacterium]